MSADGIMNGPEGKIRELIARYRPGFSLPQAFYDDPDVFRRDMERFVMRHWVCVGHVSRVPNPGDYFLYEAARESVIIVRGADRELRALTNVCRHRGSHVCREKAGNAKVFLCPYHAWAYNLDGTLRSARHMPEDFDGSAYGLKRIHLRVVEGLILVSFAKDPLGLAEVERTLTQGYGPYGWADAKVAHRAVYKIDANWKLAVENYVECYHCAPAHPEYSKLHANEQPRPKIAALVAEMNTRAAACDIAIENRDKWALDAAPGEEAVYCVRYPMYDKTVTGTDDGKPAAPLMGSFKDYDGGSTFIHIGPASFFLAYPDHGLMYLFIPKTPQYCEMEVCWLVRGDAVAGKDYDLARLVWLWDITSAADKRIIEDNQKGINSRFYEPGPFAPMEINARRLADWYLKELA
ncbi:MAG: aromatic ring-hydroxylating dioxygenase subunit alpha [Alphaproteobacteria bacterium]